ncbi:NUDIX hydrolase [Pseudoalteromonas fenneropenaei]|uniref:NUDIX hydrolase n=1 Tax=Pseudoalteromonas fenneropenaei TaxID=1737459 RepID=A0ABV7CEX8_9GAMM
MKNLNLTPPVPLDGERTVRHTARAIVIENAKILMVYTGRYDDYSIPGGGVNPNETVTAALKRELHEETGAHSIAILKPWGQYREYRRHSKQPEQVMEVISHYYFCALTAPLGAAKLEDYEIRSGVKAVWLSLDAALQHNLNTQKGALAGQALQREIDILQQLIALYPNHLS